MKKFLAFLFIFIIIIPGCGQSKSQSKEEVISLIDEKLIVDIDEYSISDFYVEENDNKPLKITRLSNAAFDYLYTTIDSEASL